MEVNPDSPETDNGGGAWREKVDGLLLLCVIGFAAALAVAGYLLEPDTADGPADAESARAVARRLQPYASKAECWQPLEAYCEDRQCPVYTVAVARVQRFAVPHGDPRIVGTCGEFRYTYMHDGHHSLTLYFDAAEKLVAAHTTTSALSMNMECRNWTHYGPRIECKQTIVRDYSAPLVPERLPPRRGRRTRWPPGD